MNPMLSPAKSYLAHIDPMVHPLMTTCPSETLGFEELSRLPIRILTYNLFLRPVFVKNKDSDYKAERLEEFAAQLHEYDIFCSQEAFVGLTKHKAHLVRWGLEHGFLW